LGAGAGATTSDSTQITPKLSFQSSPIEFESGKQISNMCFQTPIQLRLTSDWEKYWLPSLCFIPIFM
jgi:hypothetical protein